MVSFTRYSGKGKTTGTEGEKTEQWFPRAVAGRWGEGQTTREGGNFGEGMEMFFI